MHTQTRKEIINLLKDHQTREDAMKKYEPTKEGLTKGLSVARTVGQDEVLFLYSTAFLFDHLENYEDNEYDTLYNISLEYAFKKRIGELELTETELKLLKENPYYSEIMGEKSKVLNRGKYFTAREIGLPMM